MMPLVCFIIIFFSLKDFTILTSLMIHRCRSFVSTIRIVKTLSGGGGDEISTFEIKFRFKNFDR